MRIHENCLLKLCYQDIAPQSGLTLTSIRRDWEWNNFPGDIHHINVRVFNIKILISAGNLHTSHKVLNKVWVANTSISQDANKYGGNIQTKTD